MADETGASTGEILLNQPVVLDNGTSSVKAGFAGGSKPKVVVGAKVGRTKHMRIMPGGALEEEVPGTTFVGKKLDDHRGAFLLEHCMDKGTVINWEGMESIWEHTYSKTNLNAPMEDHPTLLTEAPLNPRTNREKTAQIFFETFRVPAVYFAAPSVLSLYASGRTTGVVLDVGEGLMHCIPVYEGHALQHSVSRSDVGGREVTHQLQMDLRRAGLPFTTTAESFLCKSMKEDLCYVATSSASEEDSKEAMTQYQLPDGQTITVSSERYQAPEILFDPSLIGSEEAGAAEVLMNSVQKSDLDLRPTLFSQIVLSGGSSLLPGFGDRLLAETRSRCSAHTRIRISAPPARNYSAYVGGSILASLATFKSMWVTKEEYEEHGDSILRRGGL
mmetsp:Transcript_42303/g.62759  ORF Transcript_42303/g.62759 Transcript_42303/m.62759 type:complete len:388 (-) Transcript_42303:114-1277(-)|eukprot:CAMPEP_0194065642 /NCGR_PEP_ID=MMETSP0009_2-20130614/85583_1 /TAXON_ID=210454 /ORGANISM="Grammatophora oceanica, Strain CCMP 410" /LENGTH=387 /DNA_ID=CAMNT_0038718511 /DNA_START=92 /DNA_END=1255 /DNA_ORIENTATION=+